MEFWLLARNEGLWSIVRKITLLRIGLRDDTSCMKAHVVKWGEFLLYVLFLAAPLRGRVRHGCLVKVRALASPFLASLSFVLRPWIARHALSS